MCVSQEEEREGEEEEEEEGIATVDLSVSLVRVRHAMDHIPTNLTLIIC